MASRISPYVDNTGLVFAYDLANVKRSYLGQPTTNTVGQLNSFNPLDLFTWASSGNTSTWSRDTTAPLSPVKGIPLKEISSGTDSYSSTYNNTVNNISTASSGQIWTVSVYALAAAGTNLQLWLFEANSSGGYIELSAENYTATGKWQRIALTRTLTNGSTAAVQARVATTTNGGVIWWDGLQMEQKSYATQFTTGTRSVTQGLKDLTGKSTIDLTNVSFDSNAQMTFDGTDDKLQGISTVHSHLSSSAIEFVVTPTTIDKRMTVGGYRHNQGYSAPTIGSVYIQTDNKFYGSLITAAEVYRQVGSTTVISANKTYHVVFNKDTSAGIMQMYVNGVLEGTQTFNTATYAQWSSAGSYIGSDILDLGKSNNTDLGQGWSGDFLQGKLNTFRLYGRTLSASEIQQNFNAIKGRYGL